MEIEEKHLFTEYKTPEIIVQITVNETQIVGLTNFGNIFLYKNKNWEQLGLPTELSD